MKISHPHLKACLLIPLLVQLPPVVHDQDSPRGKPPPLEYLRPTFYDNKLTEAQKRILSPSPEDQTTFAAFLKGDKTGLFRVLPKSKYEFSKTISADRSADSVLPILGGGAFYSFTKKTHKFGPWSEIYFENGHLHAGPTVKTIGMFTALGDAGIESVSLKTPAVAALARLIPPRKYSDVVALNQLTRAGFKSDGFAYGSAIEPRAGATYAVRSIAYKRDGYLLSPDDKYTRVSISQIGYDGSDILVVFRVVRQDADGSLVILWKEVQRLGAPDIKGEPKRKSFADVKKLLEQKVTKGMSASEVIALLDLNGIRRSDYIRDYQYEDVPGTTGLISATVPDIERKARAVFDLYIQFFFNQEGRLLDYRMKKVRSGGEVSP